MRPPSWADLREDKIINPASCFWPGPGSLGTVPVRKIAQVAHHPRRTVLRPVRGYFVFAVPAAKNKNINDKHEASHRLARPTTFGSTVFSCLQR